MNTWILIIWIIIHFYRNLLYHSNYSRVDPWELQVAFCVLWNICYFLIVFLFLDTTRCCSECCLFWPYLSPGISSFPKGPWFPFIKNDLEINISIGILLLIGLVSRPMQEIYACKHKHSFIHFYIHSSEFTLEIADTVPDLLMMLETSFFRF